MNFYKLDDSHLQEIEIKELKEICFENELTDFNRKSWSELSENRYWADFLKKEKPITFVLVSILHYILWVHCASSGIADNVSVPIVEMLFGNLISMINSQMYDKQ